MPGLNLEELKQALDPDKLTILCASIKDLEVAADRSVLRADVTILPDGIVMTARMSWDLVAPDAGLFQFPSKNDLVLVGFCEGHEDDAFILRRLTSKEDKIPIKAVEGHLVLAAKKGTKTYLNSDTEIHLTRHDSDGDEALVLGNTFRDAYSEHLDIDSTHTHIGNMGYDTSIPNETADYIAIKTSPVDDDVMLSDLSKTEK